MAGCVEVFYHVLVISKSLVLFLVDDMVIIITECSIPERELALEGGFRLFPSMTMNSALWITCDLFLTTAYVLPPNMLFCYLILSTDNCPKIIN